MEMNPGELMIQVQNRLDKGGAPATGMGAFGVMYWQDGDRVRVLLRRRKEKDSIIYGRDLSGKWETFGGGMRLEDLIPGQEGYLGSIATTIRREAMEEAGLNILSWHFSGAIYPAILAKEDDKQSLIDFAFSVPIEWHEEFATADYQKKLAAGDLQWVDLNDLVRIDFVSARMGFIIIRALKGALIPHNFKHDRTCERQVAKCAICTAEYDTRETDGQGTGLCPGDAQMQPW
jgi:8-oxo-dGTP pyrophosphatase MutT (NUDIX family)